MKKILLFLFITAMVTNSPISAQLLRNVKKALTEDTKHISNEDAVAGIKEALIKGTDRGVEMVSVKDGYFGNNEIKIPFPPEAKS
ncbi:MAG: DUF4197 family protein, partial [Bacteroidales bacterium]